MRVRLPLVETVEELNKLIEMGEIEKAKAEISRVSADLVTAIKKVKNGAPTNPQPES